MDFQKDHNHAFRVTMSMFGCSSYRAMTRTRAALLLRLPSWQVDKHINWLCFLRRQVKVQLALKGIPIASLSLFALQNIYKGLDWTHGSGFIALASCGFNPGKNQFTKQNASCMQ
ncbi:hypothetical protein Tco_0231896 [Tanacetum coccineum]